MNVFFFDFQTSTDAGALAFPVLRWLRGKAEDSVCFPPAALLSSLLPGFGGGKPEVHPGHIRYGLGPGSRVLGSLSGITSTGSSSEGEGVTGWRPKLSPDVPHPLKPSLSFLHLQASEWRTKGGGVSAAALRLGGGGGRGGEFGDRNVVLNHTICLLASAAKAADDCGKSKTSETTFNNLH